MQKFEVWTPAKTVLSYAEMGEKARIFGTQQTVYIVTVAHKITVDAISKAMANSKT